MQVIDHDQPQLTALAMQTPCPGTHFKRVEAGAFVDEHGRIVELAQRRRQAHPVFVLQAAGTHAVLIQPADGTDHAHGELGSPHFHGKHRHRQAGIERDILGDVERKRGLTHGRTAGDNHQIPGLEPGSHRIQVSEAGRDARHVAGIIALKQLVDAIGHLRQQHLDVDETLRAAVPAFGNLENFRFGLVQQLRGTLSLRAESTFGDTGTDFNQLAHHGTLAHDLGIAPDIGSRWGVLRQRTQVGNAAHSGQLGIAFQRLCHRDDIRRLAVFDQPADMLVNDAMIVAIEIFRRQQVGNLVQRFVFQQQAAEDGLLGLNGVGRDLEGCEGIVGHAEL
ncbi:hypothetical protein GALL_422120 [mine drainage metagenome]|uniref:Uncharacterized protein n=1 Tax=mine drainage metagenome TaxID=410659 RepID=A0A1J5Q888_9ZZZZ